jgi:hypothetical protein
MLRSGFEGASKPCRAPFSVVQDWHMPGSVALLLTPACSLSKSTRPNSFTRSVSALGIEPWGYARKRSWFGFGSEHTQNMTAWSETCDPAANNALVCLERS